MLTKDEIKSLNIINLEDGSKPPESSFDITSYNLRLGKNYIIIEGAINSKEFVPGDCSSGVGILKMPPFSCALVSSEEWVKLPSNVYGRWGLKIRPAMAGLVFQAGPQIEPSSQSRLFGLLFNLSSNEKQLPYLTPLWSIDFHRISSSKRKIVEPETFNPILDMYKYTQLGIPTGSLSEIYAEFKKLQRQVVGRREIFVTIFLTIVVLISSTMLPIIINKLTSSNQESIDLLKRQSELLIKIDEREKNLRDLEKRVRLEIQKIERSQIDSISASQEIEKPLK